VVCGAWTLVDRAGLSGLGMQADSLNMISPEMPLLGLAAEAQYSKNSLQLFHRYSL